MKGLLVHMGVDNLMKNYKNENCIGCTIYQDNLRCCKYNEGSCPCTNCIVKMMKCDPAKTVNDSCDKWRSWFNEYYMKHKGWQYG